jgi:hypothetical protein
MHHYQSTILLKNLKKLLKLKELKRWQVNAYFVKETNG